MLRLLTLLTPVLLLLSVPLAWAQGDCSAAQGALRRAMLGAGTSGAKLPMARLALARCLRGAGRLEAARTEAEAILGEVRGAERSEAFEIVAAAAVARGLTARAAQALHRAWKGAPSARRPALRALAAKLTGPNEAELRFAHDALPRRGFPAGHLALRLAGSAFTAGRISDAVAYLKRARTFAADDPQLHLLIGLAQARIGHRTLPASAPPTNPPVAVITSPRVPTLPTTGIPGTPRPTPGTSSTPGGVTVPGTGIGAVSSPQGGPRVRIAVLAPLSGPARGIGERIRKGVRLARTLEKTAQIEVLFRDTRGDAQEARRLVEELARDPLLMAIVGPVLSRPATAAARRAQELGVPMVGLSAALGLTSAGDRIFRIFLTPRRQAETVARYAVERLKLRRLGILHPQTGYGIAMANAFSAEAVRLGARVVGMLSYRRGQAAFSKEARALRGWRMDGLFFPEGYRTVALAAGYLASGGLPIGEVAGKKREIRLLGTNEWYAGDLLRLAGRYLQRAVLAVGFSLHSERPEAKTFLKAFRDTFQHVPTYVEAFAYDAVRTVGTLFARGSAADRASLQRALGQTDLPGVTGRIRFGARREIVTKLEMVEISGNAFGAAGKPARPATPLAVPALGTPAAKPAPTESQEERALREALRRARETPRK